MDVLYERWAGLDVHKASVVACLITPAPSGHPLKQLRTFGTVTPQIAQLAAWLRVAGCTHVAMESTGIYWRPIRVCSTSAPAPLTACRRCWRTPISS
jgi:hypothetical protein